MVSRRKLYEGKAKILYEGPEAGTLVQYFKDDATAFNAEKKGSIAGKGVLNNFISERVFSGLETIGVRTHYLRRLNMREQLIRRAEIVPLEVIVRNVVAGSMAKRLGLDEGLALQRPVVEFSYKNDALGDPMVSAEHILSLGWANEEELETIVSTSLRVDDFLCGLFAGVGIKLVDFKLEFGRVVKNGEEILLVADEVSPDTCRLWDMKTQEKLDKDRFRRDLGRVEEAYQEVARRLGVLPEAVEAEQAGGATITKARLQ